MPDQSTIKERVNYMSKKTIQYDPIKISDIIASGKALEHDDVFILIYAGIIDSQKSAEYLRKAIHILNDKKRTPDEEYLLGYAWYNLPDNTTDVTERHFFVEKHLKNTLRAGKNCANYLYAKELLGCQYYDVGQYEAALSIFLTFEKDAFTRHFNQGWRDVKLADLKLCCSLRLNRTNEIESRVKALFDVFRIVFDNKQDDNISSSDLALPTELIQTLKAILRNEERK
jgi:tetratricopeptide (TPR) repeat protein